MNNETAPIEEIDSIIELFNAGKLTETIDKIQTLIIDFANDPILFNIAGACYSSLNQIESAILSYKKAILLKPDFPDFYFNLGNAYRENGQLEEAAKNFKKTLEILPTNFPSLFNLGVINQQLGLLHDAAEQYENAIKSEPDNISALINLGYIYQELGEFDDAIDLYLKVLALENNNIEALNNLGVIYRELGQIDESINCYKSVISLNPNKSESYYNLGFAYQDLGTYDKAIVNYEKAIEISDHVWSYHNLSYLKKFKEDDPKILRMKELLMKETMSKLDKSHLNLALAKVHEGLGQQKDFMKFLNTGNKLRKNEMKYSIKESLEFHSTIKNIFQNPLRINNKPNSENSSPKNLIFIVGMPRSGTTLIEQILSSHNAVYGAGELQTLTKSITPIIHNFLNKDISNISSQALRFIKEDYETKLSILNTNLDVITDKLPLNFQFIGFILSIFPDAKIVHLKRNAIATCWSNYKHFFTSKNNSYSLDLNDVVDFYKSYRALMDHWHQLYPDKIYDLNYEDLTKNQENETRKLLNYCNLEWDKNCLNFFENNRAIKTPSASQVRKKMYQGSSEAWKEYESYLEPLVNGLKDY